MRRTLILVAGLALAGLGGCYAEDGAYVSAGYAAPQPVVTAGYVEPDMVVVSPGVSVVYDYDYPVFFNAGLYWRYDGGIWYSSRYHTGGWVVNRNVPYGVRGISHPEAYRHYRPAGYVPRSAAYRAGERQGVRQEQRREERREVRHTERREEHKR